jgi:hypothetical protein
MQGVGVDLRVHPRADTEVCPYNSTREETWSLHNRRKPSSKWRGQFKQETRFLNQTSPQYSVTVTSAVTVTCSDRLSLS